MASTVVDDMGTMHTLIMGDDTHDMDTTIMGTGDTDIINSAIRARARQINLYWWSKNIV